PARAEQAPSGPGDGSNQHAGLSKSQPDVYLDIPEVKDDEISLEVDDLRARVSLQAEVLDLVKLNVGVDAALGRVLLDIKGVEAKALLKVRLDNVASILNRVLTTIDRNPQILEQLTRGLGSAVEEVGRGAGGAVKDVGDGARGAVREGGRGGAVESVGEGAGGAVESVGEGAGGAVEDVGRGAGEAVEDTGEAVEGVGRGAGAAVEGVGRGAGEAVEDVGEETSRTVRDTGAAGAETVRGTAEQVTGDSDSPRRENGEPNGRAGKEAPSRSSAERRSRRVPAKRPGPRRSE